MICVPFHALLLCCCFLFSSCCTFQSQPGRTVQVKAGLFLKQMLSDCFLPRSLLVGISQNMNMEEILPQFSPVLLGLLNLPWGSEHGSGGWVGVTSSCCKCCENVVVPLVTVKGQTKVALSGAYWYWEGTTHSPCFTEPLTDSSVHIIKILHIKALLLFLFI